MTDLAVIMSVYKNDRLEFVKQSVQSILDQSFYQFHYYIIFDGKVASDIDNYISSLSDSRIKHYRLEKNGGLAGALNYLLGIVLKNSEYKLIARMDADDISIPSRFEKQRKFLLGNPEISCVGSWYQEIDENGNHLSFRKLPTDHESLRKRYFTKTPFAHPSVIFRRGLIEQAGNYPTDTVLLEDFILWGRALKCGSKFANYPEYLLKFRMDDNFLNRRTGITYGWSFIINRFRISHALHFPIYTYPFTVLVGLIKMIPTFLLRYFYKASRNG
jgi:glycosyltransferase involved in cell wall biosynthesis